MVTSQGWMKRHLRDPYVRAARKEGYRSRAAYKLLELLEHLPTLKQAKHLLELGAAPGGWTQVLAQRCPKAHIVAIDLQVMDAVAGAHIVQGDFFDPATWQALPETRFDGVFSDMMPNTSGIVHADAYALLEMLERVSLLMEERLAPRGFLVIKFFEGVGIADWRKQLAQHFERVRICKPKASRSTSKEQYFIGTGYRSC